MKNQTVIFGMHAVESFLQTQSHAIKVLYVQSGRVDKKVNRLIELAKQQDVTVQLGPRKELDRLSELENHQGVVIIARQAKQTTDFKSFVQALPENALILILDGVQDPHNFGACLRSADAAGVDAVIVPKDKAVGMTPVVRKVACGAADIIPIYTVTNLVRAMEQLQQQGVWIYGAAGEATESVYQTNLSGSLALVLGAEGKGLRRLTRETCDHLINIPMHGSVSSLNVSVATGIILFETVRQRLA